MSRPKLNHLWYHQDIYDDFQEYLIDNGFQYLGSGAFRSTFQRGKIVVKIPRSQCGVEDNVGEAYAYNRYRKEADERGTYYAPCRLLSNGCLMMVYVEKVDWDTAIRPQWIDLIDDYQCGYFHDRIVCYDSGCDIEHLWMEAMDWGGLKSETA
jgi:hypothetical protein